MVGHYESFFTASAGASAAILGLLVVAVSVVNADDANPTTRELRTVLAGSAYIALVDIFFVSIVALTGARSRSSATRCGSAWPSRSWRTPLIGWWAVAASLLVRVPAPTGC